MDKKKAKTVFVQGAIPSEKIAQSIASHQSKTNIGAHSIFLGQIREDEVKGKKVSAIEYTAYEEMAEKVFHEIREAAFSKFDITCAHIYHSLGEIKTGELCLFVFTSSAHRKIAIEACNYFVEEIKAKVPIFGKEIFGDETHQWKVNR
ncbi:molybdenum cofactor biosynthesis protein MoaE [Antarcticibacterium sp. 1MA-6-2]|uniref:molybdenum cofactor biosynthesis protein MoaE n=1 Tax=Antarcticibacterium sp. 1MA-6-2 TaxID=2908210 RepID=UPI001F42C2AF|nr:molybdenum cofactor biosynthesis protein MoaE [Antarcticibacterium sp. 1MA-6-2]UJH90973.1 molybdenum cofactor biosynthesis protein MoaE [Antarcticibacterium sp. 1MA-6-2]